MGTVNYGELAKGAGEVSFEPLEPGQYEAEVTGAEFRTAKTGSHMYRVEFTVDTGPSKGKKVWTNLVLKHDSPNNVSIFFQRMAALGLDAAFFAAVGGDEQEAKICQRLIGAKSSIKVKLGNEYEGQRRPDVERITARVGSSVPVTTVTAPAPAAAATPTAAAPPDLPPGL